ncbi:hypothetical protein VTI74DRAFT_4008 [Chaetomium olivicolor]
MDDGLHVLDRQMVSSPFSLNISRALVGCFSSVTLLSLLSPALFWVMITPILSHGTYLDEELVELHPRNSHSETLPLAIGEYQVDRAIHPSELLPSGLEPALWGGGVGVWPKRLLRALHCQRRPTNLGPRGKKRTLDDSPFRRHVLVQRGPWGRIQPKGFFDNGLEIG